MRIKLIKGTRNSILYIKEYINVETIFKCWNEVISCVANMWGHD